MYRHHDPGPIPAISSVDKVAHTPGPWRYQEESDAYTHIVRGPENQFITQLGQDTSGVAEADARLIATAPDLLSALKSLRNEAAGALGFAKRDLIDGLGETNIRCIENRIAEADAVIARAENQ